MVRGTLGRIILLGCLLFVLPSVLLFLLYSQDLDITSRLQQKLFLGLHSSENDARIDYHDYAQIERDLKREGPGENGRPYKLPPDLDAKKGKLYSENGFNGLASDQIALDRSLPDIRHPACKKKKYLSKLLTVSVIITLYNEHWTTLLRNVYSAINRAPPGVVKEVILVDDGSTKEFLKDELDKYLETHIPIAKAIHKPNRTGLMHGRLTGARAATGDVLLFLDSHVECNVNYLPPLIEPITINKRTVVCPFIDGLNYETFEYIAQDEGRRGSFDWNFLYKRLPLRPEDLEHPADPFPSPVMAGGLFAISREFFWEIGGYDEELLIWGGEQYELSFKIWMCGGTMVDAPCSRIAHIYRKYGVFPDPHMGDFLGRNYRRVAEVWMDEYAEFLYRRRPHYRNIDPGDLTIPRGIRKNLNCKSFKWFMEYIAYDQIKYYPQDDPKDFGFGTIKSMDNESLCIDTKHQGEGTSFGVERCGLNPNVITSEQNFVLTWRKDLRPKGKGVCFDQANGSPNGEIILYGCHGGGGNQMWYYDVKTRAFQDAERGRCLDYNPITSKVVLNPCSPEEKTQMWQFEHVDTERLNEWDIPY